MSDEEHHFESKADAGASENDAGTIPKSRYFLVKTHPSKVVKVSTSSKTGKPGHATIEICTAEKLEDIADVAHVDNWTDYKLIDISDWKKVF
ncbi:Eukaryotic translation initiation factor 5A-5 [Castilleja foliolosa]|uniref:Eukaryotic translation initiation factor 5A-5 n=1 Tax=Castilleja foliolosa TaxID=1961234 RepID=A0ABD3D399_9LAMI